MAIRAAISLRPQYAELLSDLQNGSGRVFFSSEITKNKKIIGVENKGVNRGQTTINSRISHENIFMVV